MLSLVSAKALDASKPTTVMTSGIIAIINIMLNCGYCMFYFYLLSLIGLRYGPALD